MMQHIQSRSNPTDDTNPTSLCWQAAEISPCSLSSEVWPGSTGDSCSVLTLLGQTLQQGFLCPVAWRHISSHHHRGDSPGSFHSRTWLTLVEQEGFSCTDPAPSGQEHQAWTPGQLFSPVLLSCRMLSKRDQGKHTGHHRFHTALGHGLQAAAA